ncbi:MAG: ABC transporter permease [Legionellales bacterium]
MNQTNLSTQEQQWILEQRVTRIADNQEVLIYPMGAERYLSLVLLGEKKGRYHINADITGKDVLVIPGYGTSGFLFAQAQAKSITVYDKDPVTIAWMKAFKKYYNYRESHACGKALPSIGELLTALTCWYPPVLALPTARYKNALFWLISPNSLRRVYLHYMIALVRHAIKSQAAEHFELDKNIQFHVGELSQLIKNNKQQHFDTAYVPYLLGVKNGIETVTDIVHFMEQLITLVPNGRVLVSPSQNTKEFYIMGQRYFITTGYASLQAIPKLSQYVVDEDKYWFRTQGLAIFASGTT